ncbi:LysM peptidoglycan-binding domain-containing protein [Sporosarcina luteola]|uniref:cell division suppressor protein YneA n=1 Tax=Sporosarcina luteola TaxID=582850 RepID=UPI00203A94B9|nr:LysM peptidoglycan-binding domain-containing protein [Sporosarcina luteola]MCM3637792.1 LysM peptidoglycan-binding domain-containing protein [Sporosarcina luteola]
MTFIQKYGFILLIIFLCTAFTLVGVMKEVKSASTSFVEVTITEGDTLWGLAKDYSSDEHSEKWIAKVMEMNGMQSTMIKSGEILKLPKVDSAIPDPMMTELAGD